MAGPDAGLSAVISRPRQASYLSSPQERTLPSEERVVNVVWLETIWTVLGMSGKVWPSLLR